MQPAALDRRRFLHCASAAAGAGLVAAAAPEGWAAEKPKQLKKSLKIGMVKTGGTLADKFKLLKKIGFDGVELNSPNDLKLDEVLAAKEASGLEVPGVIDSAHWKQRISDPDPAVRAEGLAALKTAIRDAKAYGATSVLLVPGKVVENASYEQCWERSQPEIRKAIPLAEELGIHILLENVWNDFLTDPAETAKYIDQLDSKMVGAYFDVGNAVRYAPPVEWVRTLGERIVKLDIKEYSLAKAKENIYAGFGAKLLEGDCNWPAVMKEVRQLKRFTGWGSAEVRGGDEARLREIAERMDRIYAL